MKHRPGSFSKNFAWHGDGLRKLHTVVRSGFGNSLAPPSREGFLQKCGLDQNTRLLPVNFYLHNKDGMISVDELVYQAVCREFTSRFNYLGLFALHLSNVGAAPSVSHRPAMWANKFVCDRLWSNGSWQSGALDVQSLTGFMERNLDAQPSVIQKCRSNYRHLFYLCGLIPTNNAQINTRSEHWLTPALFLAWDRHIMDGKDGSKSTLLGLCYSESLYKLLGVDPRYLDRYARQLVNEYLDLGGPSRFRLDISEGGNTIDRYDPADLWQIEGDVTVERSLVTRMQQKRNRKFVTKLKKLYKNTCMFCDTRLQVGNDLYYSQVAHIRPLGMPHNGTDKTSNMLVLCMNHHLQFDRGVLSLVKTSSGFEIVSQILGDPLDGKGFHSKHQLDDKCVDWHYKWYRQEFQ